jgi:3-dehydroquinate synthase
MYSTLEIQSKINNYSIHFVETLNKIQTLIDQPNTITFIDSNVSRLYPELSRDTNVVIECTENIKTLEGTYPIFQSLIDRKSNINTKIIVIGGGILQDLIGFCSSIYCRGIEYILVPTTLLSQADSCVGGKTSLNLTSKKNILGTFYPPTEIVIYPDFVKTLSKLDYISGLGEIYKFHILQNNIDKFNIDNPVNLMIYEGLKYKIDILSRDEFDKGERKYLNFGHTFGHALETTSHNVIPHGIAVIIGCMIAVTISKELGYNIPDYTLVMNKGIELIKESNIKFNKKWFDFNSLSKIIKNDKKSTGKLTMVLINNGPYLDNVEEICILDKILNIIYESI